MPAKISNKLQKSAILVTISVNYITVIGKNMRTFATQD
jgi:hypothetical protein